MKYHEADQGKNKLCSTDAPRGRYMYWIKKTWCAYGRKERGKKIDVFGCFLHLLMHYVYRMLGFVFLFFRDWCFRLTPVTQMTPSKSSHLDQFIWSGSKVWTWLRTTTPLIIATYPFPPRGYAENSIPSQSRALAPFISGNNTTAAGLKEAILTLRHRS